MNRLQLATLLSWAGENGIEGRKRLQKVVFFLQAAGCPLECKYTLHHFGPYSRDVADACDELVAAGLVDEKGGPATGGAYAYTLRPAARGFLEPLPKMQQFAALGAELVSTDLWQLELGSTVLHFYGRTRDWDQALARACAFKRVPSTIEPSRSALALAQRIHQHVGGVN